MYQLKQKHRTVHVAHRPASLAAEDRGGEHESEDTEAHGRLKVFCFQNQTIYVLDT